MIFICLFSSKYIDSRLFWSSLELLYKLYELRKQPVNELRQQPVYEWHEVHLLKDLFNIQKDWNVSIVYHPSYLEIYRHAQSYLNFIKEALKANDLFSLFAYNRDKLKKVISTQKISNLNFEESLSTYSCNDTLLHKRYSSNLFERMDKYIKFKSHDNLPGSFYNKHNRNLLVAFTTDKEWENFTFDGSIESLLNKFSLKTQFEDKLIFCLYIIVFPIK